MEVYKFTMGWENLDKVPEDQRILALMLGKLFNDLSILGKWLNWIKIDEKEIDIERHGRAAQVFMLMTLLAGKLIEGWELLGVQYFGSKLAATYHPLLGAEGQQSIDDLKSYFSKNNVLRIVRKQHAFHYDPSLVKEDYANLPREEASDFYLSTSIGFSLFQVSEAVASGALLRKIGEGDGSRGMNTLVQDVIRTSAQFQSFTAAFMMAFFKLNWKEIPQEVRIDIGKRPAMDSVSIPFLAQI